MERKKISILFTGFGALFCWGTMGNFRFGEGGLVIGKVDRKVVHRKIGI